MVEQAARCLADAEADPRDRLHRDRCHVRLLVSLDHPQRLVAGVDELDRTDDDAQERVAARRPETGLGRRLLRERGEPVAVQRVPGERPAEVDAAVAQARVQRIRALYVLLAEVCVVLGRREVEPGCRDDPAALDRVLVRARQRDELAIDGAIREVEACDPAHRFERGDPRPLERLAELEELAARRRAVEAADAHVDRMDLPAAHDGHEAVARLLQGKSSLDRGGCVPRELDRSGIAEEVGCVKHVDVQRVALDPFAAVEEPTQQPDRLRDVDAAEALEGVDGARLVRDGADPADSRGDVRRLEERPPAQQRLEEPRGLEDAQLHMLDPIAVEHDPHRALAFDAREVIRLDRPPRHSRPAAFRNSSAAAVNVLKTRTTPSSSTPCRRRSGMSALVFGVSIGPKQP